MPLLYIEVKTNYSYANGYARTVTRQHVARRWLLLETTRWRAQDAKTAVHDLFNDGRVRAESAGRLTKASLVTLR